MTAAAAARISPRASASRRRPITRASGEARTVHSAREGRRYRTPERAWIGELEDEEHQGGHGHGNDGLAPGGPADPPRPHQGYEHDGTGHQQDEDRRRHLDHQRGGPEPDVGPGPRHPEQESRCAPGVVGRQELQALEVGLGNEERRVHHDGRIEHDVDGPHQRPGRHHDHERAGATGASPSPPPGSRSPTRRPPPAHRAGDRWTGPRWPHRRLPPSRGGTADRGAGASAPWPRRAAPWSGRTADPPRRGGRDPVPADRAAKEEQRVPRPPGRREASPARRARAPAVHTPPTARAGRRM